MSTTAIQRDQAIEICKVDLELHNSIANTMSATKDLPGFKLYWQQRGPMFDEGFRAYIEALGEREETSGQEIYNLEGSLPSK